MRLFGKYQGEYALDCVCSGAVDAVASRTGNKIYVHMANTDMHAAQKISLNIGEKASMHFIAADPRTEITPDHAEVFQVESVEIDTRDFVLPAAAVAALEIEV